MNNENVTPKTSLNAGQINALIEALVMARANVGNYVSTKHEMFGILAQQQLDAAIELLYEEEE